MEKLDEVNLKQLVCQISQGNESAFAELYALFSSKIYHTARKMDLGHEEAEEIVQEVFLKIWKFRERLDPERSINAYMLAIVKSLVIKKVRKEARFFAFQQYQIPIEEKKRVLGPEEELIFTEFHGISMDLIDQLPSAQKEVFKMKHLENQSVEEISQKLNVSRRTVENQIFRSTKSLKEGLKKWEIVTVSVWFLGLEYFVYSFIK